MTNHGEANCPLHNFGKVSKKEQKSEINNNNNNNNNKIRAKRMYINVSINIFFSACNGTPRYK